MLTTIVAAVLLGQYGYLQAPLPIYNPAGYHRRYPEYIFPYVSGVGNPKVIELPGIEEAGVVQRVDVANQMITLRLPHETVLVHYGPKTYWTGSPTDLRPGVAISVNEVKRRITILGGR